VVSINEPSKDSKKKLLKCVFLYLFHSSEFKNNFLFA
jgi:hypothetical protein